MSGVTLTQENGGIAFFQTTRLAHMLNIEIVTGLRHSRGSVMLACKAACGSKRQTKRGVLADYVRFVKAAYPMWDVPATIAGTLATNKRSSR